jgi:hypothetical protein
MAFVLVLHLDPDLESLLAEILQRSTTMPVIFALDQMAVEANHVYIIPPNREMSIFNGVLQLSMLDQAHGRGKTINIFLRSLAEDQAEDAIGIILSGTLSDGTLGLGAIHDAGGHLHGAGTFHRHVGRYAAKRHHGWLRDQYPAGRRNAVDAAETHKVVCFPQLPAYKNSELRTAGLGTFRPFKSPS